jgi:hypothetical protein
MTTTWWAIRSLWIVAVLALVVGGAWHVLVRAAASPPPSATAAEPWMASVALVNRTLEAGDIGRAIAAWPDAYGAALASRRWEAMLAVGDGASRIGQVAGVRSGFDDKARQCYVTALFRARQQQSIDGALLAADAFARLGDREVASKALRMAEMLARRAPEDTLAPQRVAAVRDRLQGKRIH